MAPIFKKVAQEYVDKAVFVKVDTNAQPELSQRYQIRSLPTFQFFINAKKVHQTVGGIGEQGLQQETSSIVRQAESENVLLTLEALLEYYQKVDSGKEESEVNSIYQKCVKLHKKVDDKNCIGGAATQLARKLKKKYKTSPLLVPRFTAEQQQSSQKAKEQPSSSTQDEPPRQSTSPKSASRKAEANLHLATKEELLLELERRLDEERDAQVEDEVEAEDEMGSEVHGWTPSGFPEKVVIVGGGPAGLSAAVYAARAGLTPLIIAPSMGGQLQGKGVEVENYPGLFNDITGPTLVSMMRQQAAHFGAVFEDDIVIGITRAQGLASSGQAPLVVQTNSTGKIEAHSVIVATGADANWLGIPGEWELRGGGVSSCATCDGFLYSGKKVVVVGGGDAAMEDALVLARTSESVTLVHRRDRFRASKVLADRVLNHPTIHVRWNTTVKEIIGEEIASSEGDEEVTKVVSGAILRDVESGTEEKFGCDAVFVAIGHTPNTSFLKGVVEFDSEHPGYVATRGQSTQTSEPGIFAAGDVSDAVYRQAITSAGSGAAAALDAERYLSENNLGNEAEQFEAQLMAELMESENSVPTGSSYNAYEESGGKMEGMRESLGAEL